MMRYFLALPALALVAGCCGGTIDVTRDRRYHGGYAPGATYHLAEDVILVPERAEYRLSPDDYLLRRRHPTIPAGTPVRVTRIELVGREEKPTYCVHVVVPWGRLSGGDHAGKPVNLVGLSTEVYDPAPPPRGPEVTRLLRPDPRFLR